MSQSGSKHLALKASDHPEHDKLATVKDASQAIGEFIDYGLPRMGLVICEEPGTRRNRSLRPVPTSRSIQSMLADWFDIDEQALEAEKRAMLAALQEMNG